MATKQERQRQLSQETLIDTIEVLEQRINGLEKQVRELKKLLQLSSTPPVRVNKTLENSSKPSGQREKGKRGPKAGHQGQSRHNSTPDEIVECRATVCRYCGETLAGLAQQEIGRQQVIDLPAFRYIVREAHCYTVDCPACGEPQRGNYPVGFETLSLILAHQPVFTPLRG